MYNLYLQLGVDGLRGLANYIEDDHVSIHQPISAWSNPPR